MKIGKTHDLIQCANCNWQHDGIMDKGNPSYIAQKHANKTGHLVYRETANAMHYKPKL